MRHRLRQWWCVKDEHDGAVGARLLKVCDGISDEAPTNANKLQHGRDIVVVCQWCRKLPRVSGGEDDDVSHPDWSTSVDKDYATCHILVGKF